MTPSLVTIAPSISDEDEQETDLLMYAGRLLQTPSGLAHAVLEYAHFLARRGTADLVTLPIVHDGRPHEVRLLVGGSVPVAALTLLDREPSAEADAALEDLRARTPQPETAAEVDAGYEDAEALLYAYSDWL